MAMNDAAIHVCIASGESLPNLLPVLQLKPAEVWVLRTEPMHDHARYLCDALRSLSVACRTIAFDDASFATMRQAAEELALQLDGRPCVLNVTGGTKLMTLAMTQVLARLLEGGGPGPGLLYVDTEHQRLEWVGHPTESQPMEDVLRIEPLLLAQGLRNQSDGQAAYRQRDAEQRKLLTRMLGDEAAQLDSWFGEMNWLADQALGGGDARAAFQPVQNLGREPRGKEAEALRRAVEHALLAWDGGRRIEFRDAEAARYFRGGWLEELAAAKASGIFKSGERYRCGLIVQQLGSETRNELDLIAVARNRVLVVECKTGALREEKASDTIYKLSQVARTVGGRLATPLLLSARRLPDEARARAGHYGVKVLEAQDLARLPQVLRDWVAG